MLRLCPSWLARRDGMCLLADGLAVHRASGDRSAEHPERQADPSSDNRNACRRTRQSWLGLGVFLLLAGWVGPDSLGPGHGEYLPQRVELLGLAALVPALDFKIATRWGRRAGACWVVAFASDLDHLGLRSLQ